MRIDVEVVVYRFEPIAPLDLTPQPEPAADDRSGPPLSQGYIFTLIATVAPEYCDPATLDAIATIEGDAWYHGQNLESILNRFEAQDESLPAEVGKNIYYSMQSQFRAMGLASPQDVVLTLPSMWQFVTRGDSGAWRSTMVGPHHARLELEQPYNCRFEHGALHGALEAFDAVDVQIDHVQCMRDGAPCCVLDVRWQEA
jgi:hypothetical protein